jgi:hypothetical protein
MSGGFSEFPGKFFSANSRREPLVANSCVARFATAARFAATETGAVPAKMFVHTKCGRDALAVRLTLPINLKRSCARPGGDDAKSILLKRIIIVK